MYIFLGNLTISQLMERTGWTFSEEEYEWLESHRQDNATIRSDSDKFHIFDCPFTIECAPSISEEVKTLLMSKGVSKESLQMMIAQETDEEKAEKKREQERLEWETKKANPEIRWMWKWGLVVPIAENREFHGFFNTECVGYHNHGTPTGTFRVMRDTEGLHGSFELDNPEINVTAHPEWNFIYGLGDFINGYLVPNQEFDWFEGRIEDYLSENLTTVMEY